MGGEFWKRFFLIVGIFVVVFAGQVFASSVSVWQGQYYTGTTFNTGTYVFNFTVYDAVTGGDVCFSNTSSLTTGTWGQWRTEQSPWGSCDNASAEYFLNINIAGSDQTPRRRLTVSDFLRRDVSEVKTGNVDVSGNVSADYFVGDGSLLTGVNGSGDINSVQGDGIYLYNGSDSGIVVLVFNESKLNVTIDARGSGDNASWNESLADGLYLGVGDESGLDVNSSVYSNSSSWWASVSGWVSGWFVDSGGSLSFNESKLNVTIDLRAGGDNSSWNESYADGLYYGAGNPFGFYNSTDFSIADYYLASNPSSYWNDSYATFNESYADGLYVDTDGDNISGNLNVTGIIYENGIEVATLTDLVSGNVTVTSIESIKNTEATTVVSGTAMRFVAYNSGLDRQDALKANNTDSLYHADCLVLGSITSGGNGQCVVAGKVTNMDTSSWAFGDNLYLNETAGTLVNERPSAADCVQKVGMILRSSATVGVIWVSGAGRCNDVSNDINISGNVSAGYFFGNGSQLTGVSLEETDPLAYNGTLAYLSDILGFNYYNSSDFSIADYYLASNPSSYWNDSYATFNESYADGLYLQNGTSVWFSEVNSTGNITAEEIHLEQDSVNHRIYDNATCIIIQGDTSTMYIC